MAEYAAYTVGTKTYITNDKGETVVNSGGTRNLRNNNCGNMNYGNFAKEHGAIGTDGRFAIFPDMETGNRAAEALLKTPGYQNAPAVPSQGFNQGSVGAAIYRWAPPSENNSASYAKFVAEKTGLDVNTPMSELSDAQISKVREAISYYEGHNSPTTVIGDSFNGSTSFADFKEKAINQTALNKAALKSGTSLKYNVSSNMAKDVRNFVDNDANFEQNVLDYYDNVTYRIRLWLLPEKDLIKFDAASESDQQRWDGKKIMIYDSASTTTLSIDNLRIDSVMAPNALSKKVFTISATFDIIEPNGCTFIDDLKFNMFGAGYIDHKHVPLFLEVSFVGYHNITDKNNPMGQDVVKMLSGGEAKRVMPVMITKMDCKINQSGATYHVEVVSMAQVASTKDFYNFTKKLEISSGCVDFNSFIKQIEMALNEASHENILKAIAEEMDEPIYSFDLSDPDLENERIDFNILASSGEAAGKSSNYVIEPGTSIEKVLDDLTSALESNKKLSVTDENKVVPAEEWPTVYRFEPTVQYKGQVLSGTKQKKFKIIYKVRKFKPSNLISTQPEGKENVNQQTQEVYTLINQLGNPIKKKYDYLFTSKNSQVLNFDIKLDFLWWVDTYESLADREKDDSAMVTNPKDSGFTGNVSSAMSMIKESVQKTQTLISNVNDTLLEYSNNGQNQTPIPQEPDSLPTVEEIIAKLKDGQKFTGMDVCVLPEANAFYETKFNKDPVAQSNVKAKSSFSQLYKGSDLVKINLTIRGDPYWLCSPQNMNINTNSSLIMNVKTPARLQSGEMMDISQDYNKVNTIWGVYNVVRIKHEFNKGKFTQNIEAVMNPNFRFPI